MAFLFINMEMLETSEFTGHYLKATGGEAGEEYEIFFVRPTFVIIQFKKVQNGAYFSNAKCQ